MPSKMCGKECAKKLVCRLRRAVAEKVPGRHCAFAPSQDKKHIIYHLGASALCDGINVSDGFPPELGLQKKKVHFTLDDYHKAEKLVAEMDLCKLPVTPTPVP